MNTQDITERRIKFLVEDLAKLPKKEAYYNDVLAPFAMQAKIFYPNLKLDKFDGNGSRIRLNVESCYKPLELIELAELLGFEFRYSTDYPESKNRDYSFTYKTVDGTAMSLVIEAYFSSATCRKKQVGTTPVYEMSCNMNEDATESPEPTQGTKDDIPF